ncbi:MAG TPA: glycosyltransferase [Candidatus Krumholzibacteria bacterium]|nr:glycosyltransferase [Candidatus Krumholzibacteria bacterium]
MGARAQSMRGVCVFGGHHAGYPRSAVILAGLARLGVSVVSCVENPRKKVVRRYAGLVRKWRHLDRGFDVVFVPEFRHKDVPLAHLLTRRAGLPCVFDPLVSRYDTRILDRADADARGPQAWHNKNLDRVSFALADLILADTRAHADLFAEQLAPPDTPIRVLEVGCDDAVFHPAPPPPDAGVATVLFYGSYLPLHGVPVVVEAAERLRDDPRLRFELVGDGQTRAEVERAVRERRLANIVMTPRVPAAELPKRIAGATVCLGIFGSTPKAARVVPNKVYQCMGMARAVVTMDSRAVRETFQVGEEIVATPPGDGEALAFAIRGLIENREYRERVARAGAARVARDFTPVPIARRFAAYCEEACAR